MSAAFRLAAPLVLAILLAACASRPQPPAAQAPVYSPTRPGVVHGHHQYGYVRSIDQLQARQPTTGGGAVAGAIVGAVIGRQIGKGSDHRAAGTAIGAVGGAIIGNQIEKNQRGSQPYYRVVVDLDRGGRLVFNVPDDGGLRPGERVRIENNQIVRL